jgi:hypothetical protein
MSREERVAVPPSLRDRRTVHKISEVNRQRRDSQSLLGRGASFLVDKLGKAAIYTAGKLAEGTLNMVFGSGDAVPVDRTKMRGKHIN